MTGPCETTTAAEKDPDGRAPFSPRDCTAGTALFSLPKGQWISMLESACTFDSEAYTGVMLNLIKNPNIMSSHLFRADIFYDSYNDVSATPECNPANSDKFTKHMKQGYHARQAEVPEFEWQRTFVRQLVPRNRQLDRDLIQTCHSYIRKDDKALQNLVLYIPHVTSANEMPWYHPKVEQLAFLHSWTHPSHGLTSPDTPGSISLHFALFPGTELDLRLERTALQLLSKVHKHGQGRKAGYVKRVHHDQIVPQQRFQETYARLKKQYAKALIGDWVEQTDPGKHVFEDLGIAAFLIELWADMYGTGGDGADTRDDFSRRTCDFPGFVDIGCGNGVLVNILAQEGYAGWGFDARRRKTWDTFTAEIQERVKEMILVPQVLRQASANSNAAAEQQDGLGMHARSFHDGIFKPGTFIISNHADELTAWTPLLAYLNDSPFIAIPCCSHDLSGARFRAPPTTRASKPCSSTSQIASTNHAHTKNDEPATSDDPTRARQAAETGSLKRAPGAQKMPSAYATLCDYVASISAEVGFVAEKEMLRIPSTRNACILGRRRKTALPEEDKSGNVALSISGRAVPTSEDCAMETKEAAVCELLARELGASLESVSNDWVTRAKSIAGKQSDGH